jgi:hypothetical protein
LVARALVSTTRSVVPLRVANFGLDTCTIHKNTVLATLDVVDQDSGLELVKDGKKNPNSNCILPEYMESIVTNCSKNLDQSQVDQVKNLLLEYQDIFSKGPNNIGYVQIGPLMRLILELLLPLRGCSMATSILHSQNFRFQITIYLEGNWDLFSVNTFM